MTEKNNKISSNIIVLLIVAFFGINFVTVMGFLNYRTAAIGLEETAISRLEAESASGIATAVSFGKTFDNFYGIEDEFKFFKKQYKGPEPFVLSSDGELIYWSGGEDGELKAYIEDFLSHTKFASSFASLDTKNGGVIVIGRDHMSLTPIRPDDETVGYFGSIYNEKVFRYKFSDIIWLIMIFDLTVTILVCGLLYTYMRMAGSEKHKDKHPLLFAEGTGRVVAILIIASGIIALSAVSLYAYQQDYREKTKQSVSIVISNIEMQISKVEEQGVDLRTVNGLRLFIRNHVSNLDMLKTIRVSDHVTEVKKTFEESDLIMYVFDTGDDNETMYVEAELSEKVIQKEMRNIVLVLFSTMLILLIFVFELNNLVELFNARSAGRESAALSGAFSEKQVSLALRFTGFLCATAESMCVPYAAMMIRDSGEALFGLSVGMTAALPLTMEGVAQMAAMLIMPRYIKKFDIRKVLIVSTVLMIACNLSAFAVGSALMIVICRALAGVAYSGFKQVSNYLITSGYETEEGRGENISQDNAGLLAGGTCGAGLGAILCANTGYATTFLFSAIFFAVYLAGTFFLVPWDMISLKSAAADNAEETSEISAPLLVKLLKSPEVILYILIIGIPLNIGVMLCVTLIPAICQTNGISSVMLSYCYLANGIAGIYIGPALVSKARKRFGLQPSIAFAFALTAFSIFILHLPPAAVMIIVTSMILGFLDGFGTPMVIDRFMELKVVRKNTDESTALIFVMVMTYVLLVFAPMVAELMLLPGKGMLTPMMAGAVVYAAAAVLLIVLRERRSKGESKEKVAE